VKGRAQVTKHQPEIDTDELRLPAATFDKAVRKVLQASPESMPERKTVTRAKAKHAKKRAK
jgi:hypothetical protein